MEISNFLDECKAEGITRVDILDLVYNLKLPADQIEKIMNTLAERGKVHDV